MSKIDNIVVEINDSGYEDGQLGAGHPAEEYRQPWVAKLRCAVAEEILEEMKANNDPWRNHAGVVQDYIDRNSKPSKGNDNE